MLLFGGQTLQDAGYTPEELSDLWLFETATNTWTKLESGARPGARKSAAGATYGGYFYIAGGYKSGVSNNIQTDFWRCGPCGSPRVPSRTHPSPLTRHALPRYSFKHNMWEAICGYPTDDPSKACPVDGDGHSAVRDQASCPHSQTQTPSQRLTPTQSVTHTCTREPSPFSTTPRYRLPDLSWSFSGVSTSTRSSHTRIRATRGRLTQISTTAITGGDVTDPTARPPTVGPWEYVANLKVEPPAIHALAGSDSCPACWTGSPPDEYPWWEHLPNIQMPTGTGLG